MNTVAEETSRRGSGSTDRRLNTVVPERLYQEVSQIAKETRLDMTDLVRLGLGIVMVVIKEARKGNKIIVTDAEGSPKKELVLPGL